MYCKTAFCIESPEGHWYTQCTFLIYSVHFLSVYRLSEGTGCKTNALALSWSSLRVELFGMAGNKCTQNSIKRWFGNEKRKQWFGSRYTEKVQWPNKKRFTPNLLLLLGGPSTWETTFAAIILALVVYLWILDSIWANSHWVWLKNSIQIIKLVRIVKHFSP